MGFDPRVDVGEGADRTGDGAGGNFRARRHQPRPAALKLDIGLRQLQPEGRRFGVDAVAAANRGCELMLEGAALEHDQQRIDVGDHQVGGADQLHVEAGVEHIRRGHPLMHEPRLRPDMFGKTGQKGDDIMFDLAFDFIDARNIKATLGPDRLRGFGGDNTEIGERVHRMGFDLEPNAETRLRLPNCNHVGARITRDHAGLLLMRRG